MARLHPEIRADRIHEEWIHVKGNKPETWRISVLFFHSATGRDEDDRNFIEQHTRETFARSEDMPEELIEAFSRQQVYLPSSVYEAEDQIRTAICFLEAICGQHTIATGGYRHGLTIIRRYTATFEEERRRDPVFLAKYLYLLDRVFQQFLRDVAECVDESDPIIYLRSTTGESSMAEAVESLVKNWRDNGQDFAYWLPYVLQGRVRPLSEGRIMDLSERMGSGGSKPSGGRGRADGTGDASPGTKLGRSGGKGETGVSRVNEADCVNEWAVPTGKSFGNFFNPNLRENYQGLPLIPHHNTGTPVAICLKYHIKGGPGCRAGKKCKLSHIRPSLIPEPKFDQISKKLREVYASGGTD